MFRKLVLVILIMAFARPFPSELQSDFLETKTKKLLNSDDGISSPDEPEETTYDLASTLNEDLNLIKKSNLSSIKVTPIEQVEDAEDSTLESPEIMEEGVSEIFQDDNSTIDLISSQVTTKFTETSNEQTEDSIPSQEMTEASELLNKQTEDTVGFTNDVKEDIAPESTAFPFFFQSNNEMDTAKTFQDYDDTIDLIMSQDTTEVTKGENAEIFQDDDTTIDLIVDPQTTERTETLSEQNEDTVVITEGINLEYTTMPNVAMISSTRKPILTPNTEAIEGIIKFYNNLAWGFVKCLSIRRKLSKYYIFIGTCEDEKNWCRYLSYNRQACRATYVKRKCQKTCNDC